LKTKHKIWQTATTCIILSSSWWWAKWCTKHVEQAIRSAIKAHLLHLVGVLFPHIIDNARSKPHQIFMWFKVLICDSTLCFHLTIIYFCLINSSLYFL
jgi:hypothetical protein